MCSAFGSVRESSLGNLLGQYSCVNCVIQFSFAKIQRDPLGPYYYNLEE